MERLTNKINSTGLLCPRDMKKDVAYDGPYLEWDPREITNSWEGVLGEDNTDTYNWFGLAFIDYLSTADMYHGVGKEAIESLPADLRESVFSLAVRTTTALNRPGDVHSAVDTIAKSPFVKVIGYPEKFQITNAKTRVPYLQGDVQRAPEQSPEERLSGAVPSVASYKFVVNPELSLEDQALANLMVRTIEQEKDRSKNATRVKDALYDKHEGAELAAHVKLFTTNIQALEEVIAGGKLPPLENMQKTMAAAMAVKKMCESDGFQGKRPAGLWPKVVYWGRLGEQAQKAQQAVDKPVSKGDAR